MILLNLRSAVILSVILLLLLYSLLYYHFCYTIVEGFPVFDSARKVVKGPLNVPSLRRRPSDNLKLLLDNTMLIRLCTQTNSYATRTTTWKDVTNTEPLTLIAIVYTMSIEPIGDWRDTDASALHGLFIYLIV